jgi:hypothetical protein
VTHTHDSLHAYHQWPADVRAHLSDPDSGHGLSIPAADRMTTDEVLAWHDRQHPAGPTPADRAAGIRAAADAALAGALRKLARQHLGELDHAHLPTKDEPVSIVATDKVGEWLEGWATRIENGESV